MLFRVSKASDPWNHEEEKDVEIKTLEDLLQFVLDTKADNGVILSFGRGWKETDAPDKEIWKIEIYDDYVE